MRNVLNANFQCRQFGLSWAQWLDFHSKLGKKVTQYEQWIIIEICTLYTLKVVTDISPSPYTCSTPFPVIISLLIGWLGKLCWWARIIMGPLPHLSRWIRGWGSLCDPHFTTAVSPTAQLMPRYQQDNVIPVHRRHYCHADNGGGKWDRFQNCYVGCQSCPLLVSNICQMQIESAVFCSHRRLGKIGMGSASHGTGSLYSHCLALYS